MYKRFAAAVLAVSITSTAMAEDAYDSSKFLQQPPENQQGYISVSAMAFGLVATRNRPDQAKCIDDWVSANKPSGYKATIDTMRQHPKYHPLAVVSAVIEKACGNFEYSSTASVAR